VKASQVSENDAVEREMLSEIPAHCRKLEMEMVKLIIRNPRDPATHRLSACHDMLLNCLELQCLVVPKRGSMPNAQADRDNAFRSAGLGNAPGGGGSRGSTASRKPSGGASASSMYEDELFKRTQRIAEARAEREAMPSRQANERRKPKPKAKQAEPEHPPRASPAGQRPGGAAPFHQQSPPRQHSGFQSSLSRHELDALHAEKQKISKRLTVMRVMVKSSIHVGERSNAQKQCNIAEARLAQIEIELSR
jgi:hypothetical protein